MRLLSLTDGRDKITKFVQYAAKLITWIMTSERCRIRLSDSHKFVHKVLLVEQQMSSARKVFRLGKFLNGYVSLAKVMLQGRMPSLLHIITLLRDINMSHYFFFDHFVWLLRQEIMVQNPKPILPGLSVSFTMESMSRLSFTSWFYAMCWALAVEVIVYYQTLSAQAEVYIQLMAANQSGDRAKQQEVRKALKEIEEIKHTQILNFIKIITDLLLSAGWAKIWNPGNGVMGICGCTAALVGAYQLWGK